MEHIRTIQQERAEDIFFGQLVIIWSRWFLILCGIILALWAASSTQELFIAVMPIAALMGMNFYFHGRYALERPANRTLVFISTLLDLVIVTVIVAVWPGGQGAESEFFIFYYLILLGFAFVFPPRFSLIYTGAVLVAYFGICLIVDTSFLKSSGLLESVTLRLVTLASMGGLAAYYWRIQRGRRREAGETIS